MKSRINIIVFSQNAGGEEIIKVARDFNNGDKILCLSTHKLFALKKKEILEKTGRELLFFSFCDFISEEEAIWCDTAADKIILEKYGQRTGNVNKYYDEIKKIKNQIILQNLKKEYDFSGAALLSDDLGICAEVWPNENFQKLYIDASNKDKKTAKIGFFKKAVSLIKNGLKFQKIWMMRSPQKNYFFCGSPARIQQYIKDDNKFERLNKINSLIFCALFVGARKLKYSSGAITSGLCKIFLFFAKKVFFTIQPKYQQLEFLSPIHEYDDSYGLLAEYLGVKMFCLQDGYLPENYSSAYLKYRENVDGYHLWDKLSAGIFERHGLKWEKQDYFRSMALPRHEIKTISVKSILVITSGAGDWTALKNRSDEDSMFEAFIKVAEYFPNIKINYRPHPLWTHPAHQGVNSIKRLHDYANLLGLKNLIVSSGALKEGDEYKKDKRVSRAPLSITQETAQADIIFGDHSQGIINAGLEGKIFASVNLSGRTSFFCNYARLGFPLLENKNAIIEFINYLQDSTIKIEEINKAIDLYNSKYL